MSLLSSSWLYSGNTRGFKTRPTDFGTIPSGRWIFGRCGTSSKNILSQTSVGTLVWLQWVISSSSFKELLSFGSESALLDFPWATSFFSINVLLDTFSVEGSICFAGIFSWQSVESSTLSKELWSLRFLRATWFFFLRAAARFFCSLLWTIDIQLYIY